ncbi:MAG: altronate oxidoreductase, partial [Muribaculaceae bacterium]|nr:altronate oxidoreductase [Muribaculaceae bacterium]
VKDNYEKAGKIADFELFTFAALLALYAPESGFTPNDTPEQVAFIQENWDDNDIEGTVAKIVNGNIFLENFNEVVPGFTAKAAEYVKDIRTEGMRKALEKFLAAH